MLFGNQQFFEYCPTFEKIIDLQPNSNGPKNTKSNLLKLVNHGQYIFQQMQSCTYLELVNVVLKSTEKRKIWAFISHVQVQPLHKKLVHFSCNFIANLPFFNKTHSLMVSL